MLLLLTIVVIVFVIFIIITVIVTHLYEAVMRQAIEPACCKLAPVLPANSVRVWSSFLTLTTAL